MEHLSCGSNNLTQIELSCVSQLRDLNCDDNLLSHIDVRNNPLFTYLHCHKNDITSLDLSGFQKLETFEGGFGELSNLDVSNCINLLKIEHYNGNLTSLDITGCKYTYILVVIYGDSSSRMGMYSWYKHK